MGKTITIIYNGPVLDLTERKGMDVCATFNPMGGYTNSPAYVQGYKNMQNAEEDENYGEVYGRSVYATNVPGWSKLKGLIPMDTATIVFAYFEQAVRVYHNACIEAKGDPAIIETLNTGVTFETENYKDDIYWIQLADNFRDQGYCVKIDDEEVLPMPEPPMPRPPFDNRGDGTPDEELETFDPTPSGTSGSADGMEDDGDMP